MRSLSTLPKLSGARVLVRVDYNVPFAGTKIRNTSRIDASFQSIKTVIKKGGTPVLIAHLGDESASLRPVATYLSKTFKTVFVTEDVTSKNILDILNQVPKGTVVLLENIRRYKGEEKNSAPFAKALARLGAYYVNDAFSVSHRAHASVVGLPKLLPSYAGIQLALEITTLSKATTGTKHPFAFILGGAKFSTKIPLLKQFVTKADHVVIAGAILNSFYKTLGFEVGKSVVEDGYEKQIKALAKNPALLLPIDVVVLRGTKKVVCTPDEVEKADVIVDIGPQSVALIVEKIKKAKLVVWNGPTGWYEKGFTKASTDIAKAIGASKAHALIGGGDTGAVIEKAVKNTKHIFISTGGGATIDFLATCTLPGIKALK